MVLSKLLYQTSEGKFNMNVLLLALSTVAYTQLNCFSYQYGDEPSFNGYYQLEPIPKFLNEKLKKERLN